MAVVVLAVLAWGFSGCAQGKALYRSGRDAALPGGAAVVAHLLAIPVGGIAGPVIVFLSVASVEALMHQASLSSGETIGEAAFEKELARRHAKEEGFREGRSFAEKAAAAFRGLVETLLFVAALVGLVWWHWRHRKDWALYGYWRGVWVHGLGGGNFGTRERRQR